MNKKYNEELKQQVLKECRDVGNVSLVARRHEISSSTIHSWIRTSRQNGSTRALPKKQAERNAEIKHRLETISTENEKLKKLVAEKELELAILRELRDTVNPQ